MMIVRKKYVVDMKIALGVYRGSRGRRRRRGGWRATGVRPEVVDVVMSVIVVVVVIDCVVNGIVVGGVASGLVGTSGHGLEQSSSLVHSAATWTEIALYYPLTADSH